MHIAAYYLSPGRRSESARLQRRSNNPALRDSNLQRLVAHSCLNFQKDTATQYHGLLQGQGQHLSAGL